jgi:hypothetical protein
MSRFLRFSLSLVGLLLLVPSAWFLLEQAQGMKSDEGWSALQPLTRVGLETIAERQTVMVDVVIPDTPQSRRIRRKWGDPEYLIAAVKPGGRDAHCLSQLGLRIEVSQQGNPYPSRSRTRLTAIRRRPALNFG